MINWNRPYASKEWKALRDAHLNKWPFCSKCSTTLNLQVDHIIEHQGDIDKFLDPNNLQTLCDRCHGSKSLQYLKLSKLPKSELVLYLYFGEGIDLKNNKFVFFEVDNYLRYSNKLIYKFKYLPLEPYLINNLLDFIYAIFLKHRHIYINIESNKDICHIKELISYKLLNAQKNVRALT
ncbi:HNH endonuclease [Mycoplasma sp. 6243]|uniref:HNH endonuclease n=1 Tax=Mycoplasma sp. 6243 TaxID=3440865 RepID=UPI003EBFD495